VTLHRLELPNDPPLRHVAAAIGAARWPMLLDSGGDGGGPGRVHHLVFDPRARIVVGPDEPGDPFARLRDERTRHFPGATRPRARPSPLLGGLVGMLGYDLARRLERLPARARPDADLPDLAVGVYPFVVSEHLDDGRRWLLGRGTRAERDAALRAYREAAERAAPPPPLAAPARAPSSTFTRAGYERAVERAREHVLDGDVYQVNLSQRLRCPFAGDPVALHEALRARFPAPFASLLRTERWQIVSSSPELFVRRRGTRLVSRPIKGTRPRGPDSARDRAQRAALEASDKERAELAMIVDLVRNDLGRSARPGSVRVEQAGETEAWSTVFHRVATVAAEVGPTVASERLVAAAFPPASVTGTPKIRACEVIESLEPVRRHAYTGAIGWIDADGDLDLSVSIRIATAVDGELLIPVGGGITLLSDPAEEYEETLHKARAMLEVLGLHDETPRCEEARE